MWLIDVHTFELQFFAVPPPRYAILSHTWGKEEVLFHHLQDVKRASEMSGWHKIAFICEEARQHELPLAWVDSCCIDKSSSAELSEAINSMFEWYRLATCCYTLLEDFVDSREQFGEEVRKSDLEKCRWFARGWTLQELIAPSEVVFFDGEWQTIGTKDELKSTLSEITGVDENVLEVMEYMYGLPVGKRMSWSSRRETTRIEDTAYCLLGIFQINMPLLYGEGERAFIRLQEEIITQTYDLSLFAWSQRTINPPYRGLFAISPAEFRKCGSLINVANPFAPSVTFSVTGRGLMIERNVLSVKGDVPQNLDLCCVDPSSVWSKPLGEISERVTVLVQKFGDFWIRTQPHATFHWAHPPSVSDIRKTICVKKTLPEAHARFIQLIRVRKLLLIYSHTHEKGGDDTGHGHDNDACIFNFEDEDTTTKFLENPRNITLCEENRISPSDVCRAKEFAFNDGGSDPTWWDNFNITAEDGVWRQFTVVCGLPLQPDVPSEQQLPWFAMFSDKGYASVGAVRISELMLRTDSNHGPSREMTHEAKNLMLQMFAGHTGHMAQEDLPTSFDFECKGFGMRRVKLDMFRGGSSVFCAKVTCEKLDGFVDNPTVIPFGPTKAYNQDHMN